MAVRREGGSVTTEAEIEVRWPQVRECQQPPEAGGSREQILPLSKGSVTLPTA